jgi:hypothetical protein
MSCQLIADTRRRESQSAIRIISLQHLIVRFPLRAMRAPKIHRLTSTVFERDRVIFVRPALFARVFVTR